MTLAAYRHDVKEIVKLAMEKADAARDDKLVKGAALAALLDKEIDGGAVGHKTVQGYARGTINPPGAILMAIAKVTEISLDKYLFGESAGLVDQVQDLRQRVKRLEEGGSAGGPASPAPHE